MNTKSHYNYMSEGRRDRRTSLTFSKSSIPWSTFRFKMHFFLLYDLTDDKIKLYLVRSC
ncbi:hypothetical protein RchiOBHm_Chr6g0250971 [Rosa chinensis]|uniref:Uncharacterized protein n=1 Tax=Rosa chinensis TaxID=74649 RepID=A0A2P6PKN5_ROSCH|nr:hypothetical protein RchiOBHm_Chr6g0250971 [Rosa chinensis]